MKLKSLILLISLAVILTIFAKANYYDSVKQDFQNSKDINCREISNNYKNSDGFAKIIASINFETCNFDIKEKIYISKEKDYDHINSNSIKIDEHSFYNNLLKNNINYIEIDYEKEKKFIRRISFQNNEILKPLEIEFNCNKTYKFNKIKLEALRNEFGCSKTKPELKQTNKNKKYYYKKNIIKPNKVSQIILKSNSKISFSKDILKLKTKFDFKIDGERFFDKKLKNMKTTFDKHNISLIEYTPIIIQKVKNYGNNNTESKNSFDIFKNSFIKYNFEKKLEDWYLFGLNNNTALINQINVELYEYDNAFFDKDKIVVEDTELFLISHKIDKFITTCNNILDITKQVEVSCLE